MILRIHYGLILKLNAKLWRRRVNGFCPLRNKKPVKFSIFTGKQNIMNPTMLSDHPVWKYFREIVKIPRPSGREERIIQYLTDFANVQGLKYRKDNTGNLLIRKPATPGFENRKTVILQSHVDMVCEKNSSTKFDFLSEPIHVKIEGEWIKASGTTLGADDGIGVASQMALLAADNINHGPLECLFTVDEECGMTGAFGLQDGFLNGHFLLNLDSEDEGELFIGCAGGIDTVARFSYRPVTVPPSYYACEITVSGLKGGHSGDEIHKGLGNSIRILTRYLHRLFEADPKVLLHKIDGGNLRNAIPREASAILCMPHITKEKARVIFNCFAALMETEYHLTDHDLKLSFETTELPEKAVEPDVSGKLNLALLACPHGALEMSQTIPGLVETSTNLASVKMTGKTQIEVTTSQRSSVESVKDFTALRVESVFKLAGGSVKHSESYPGWTPNPDSEILKITQTAYQKLFKTDPAVKAIHAGLECGLFLEKYPCLDMISFGPTIRGAHTPGEKLNIPSTYRFWDLLLEVLQHIPEIK